MLNIRQIDSKFWLSGGWTDVPIDVNWLKQHNVKAILDLQFTPNDFTEKSEHFVRETAESFGVEYLAIPMNDGYNVTIDTIYNIGFNQLTTWDIKFTGRNEKILIKCGVGVSRSPSMLINYYCVRDSLSFTEARQIIYKVDRLNGAVLPISIDTQLEIYLRNQYPDKGSAFGPVTA